MARGRPSKKQHIIDTAGLLFSELGYQATSIDVVVQTAGVSKPTVYNNFPSKLVLLHEWLIQQSKSILSMSLFDIAKLTSMQKVPQFSEKSGGQAVKILIDGYTALVEETAYIPAYRICIGESQKLNRDVVAVFNRLDFELDQKAIEICLALINDPVLARTITVLCQQYVYNRVLNRHTVMSLDEILSLVGQLTLE